MDGGSQSPDAAIGTPPIATVPAQLRKIRNGSSLTTLITSKNYRPNEMEIMALVGIMMLVFVASTGIVYVAHDVWLYFDLQRRLRQEREKIN